jgi:hypothetical protein
MLKQRPSGPITTEKTHQKLILVLSRRKTAWIASLLSFSLLLAGCTQARYASDVSPNRTMVESVAFTSMADRESIVDHAISTLVAGNFSITLANDRLGLIQTDYANLLMKVSVNAQSSNETVFVQVKGTFQRIDGSPRSADNLIGLYWLEQLTQQMAGGVEAPFKHQLTDSTYTQLVSEAQTSQKNKNNTGFRGALKVGGILLAILFAVTLAAGSFGPGSTSPTAN